MPTSRHDNEDNSWSSYELNNFTTFCNNYFLECIQPGGIATQMSISHKFLLCVDT